MVYSAKYTNATSIYLKSGLTASEVDVTSNDSQLIKEAEAEVDAITGRFFGSAIAKTEFFNGPKKDILGFSGQLARTIKVSAYPIQSITSLLILNTDGTTNTTYDTLSSAEITAGTFESADYWLETSRDDMTDTIIPTGKIILKNAEFPVGHNNIKVAYTYGYSSVPYQVADLAACLAGIRQWVNFLGGNYNRLDSYSIPQQSISKGDFYVRGEKAIQTLRDEADRLLDRIGRRPRTLFIASGQDR